MDFNLQTPPLKRWNEKSRTDPRIANCPQSINISRLCLTDAKNVKYIGFKSPPVVLRVPGEIQKAMSKPDIKAKERMGWMQ